mmetsp:Transcript_11313/g.18304  ORF Transcript_11313/g.18304 Transcript_11313/m.18304 type:complete len:354 (+) Transcript_11313:1636-2697(+)
MARTDRLNCCLTISVFLIWIALTASYAFDWSDGNLIHVSKLKVTTEDRGFEYWVEDSDAQFYKLSGEWGLFIEAPASQRAKLFSTLKEGDVLNATVYGFQLLFLSYPTIGNFTIVPKVERPSKYIHHHHSTKNITKRVNSKREPASKSVVNTQPLQKGNSKEKNGSQTKPSKQQSTTSLRPPPLQQQQQGKDDDSKAVNASSVEGWQNVSKSSDASQVTSSSTSLTESTRLASSSPSFSITVVIVLIITVGACCCYCIFCCNHNDSRLRSERIRIVGNRYEGWVARDPNDPPFERGDQNLRGYGSCFTLNDDASTPPGVVIVSTNSHSSGACCCLPCRDFTGNDLPWIMITRG